MGNKALTQEELENISGGSQTFCDFDPPTICPVCGKPLTRHPEYDDINGLPLFVCTSNIWDEDHWVLWERKTYEQ